MAADSSPSRVRRAVRSSAGNRHVGSGMKSCCLSAKKACRLVRFPSSAINAPYSYFDSLSRTLSTAALLLDTTPTVFPCISRLATMFRIVCVFPCREVPLPRSPDCPAPAARRVSGWRCSRRDRRGPRCRHRTPPSARSDRHTAPYGDPGGSMRCIVSASRAAIELFFSLRNLLCGFRIGLRLQRGFGCENLREIGK